VTQDDELSGQGQYDDSPGTDESTSLAGGDGTSSETEQDRVKELEDRLSAQGRELTDARQRAERAEGYSIQVARKLQETDNQLQAIGATLSKQETDREEAYLATLPAQEQDTERLRRRLARLEAAQSSPASRQPTPEQERADTYNQMNRMVFQACTDFGLEDSEKFQWNDPRLDTTSANTYYASARKLARKISTGQEDSTPPQRTQVWGGEEAVTNVRKGPQKRGEPNAGQLDVKAIVQETTRAVLAELQGDNGSAPHNARAVTPPNPFADLITDRSKDPYQRTLDNYSNTRGPRATRAKLKETLAEAEDKFGHRARG
jgi:hypothetical protein